MHRSIASTDLTLIRMAKNEIDLVVFECKMLLKKKSENIYSYFGL
jgi:hypothetical protein